MNKNIPKAIEGLVQHFDNLTRVIREDSRCCCNCQHFDEPKEICARWNTRPPARTIAFACKDWLYDEIPF